MPLTEFLCPDKEKVRVSDCLSSCRMGERCLTLPTLLLVSSDREWKGVASTTQLLNGTMMEFLKITKPYAVDPDSRAFMVSGMKHHKQLEEIAKELGLPAEIPMSVDRDIFDLIEEEAGGIVLTDYKTWGSFRLAKVLGIEQVGKQPDPSGEVYKSSGKWGKAGSPKMVALFAPNPTKANNFEAEMQLNRYRIMLWHLGIKVTKMQLQVTVRDGGLYIAKNRGITKNIYKIPVREQEDVFVESYFRMKQDNLGGALIEGKCLYPCTDQECWEGVRCRSFCDVAQYCSEGKSTKVEEDADV